LLAIRALMAGGGPNAGDEFLLAAMRQRRITGNLIERDLHDGLQQRLVTLGLQVRAAEVSVRPRTRS
jgi:nitrate/nitrite-specific signal transduction histidine kinase